MLLILFLFIFLYKIILQLDIFHPQLIPVNILILPKLSIFYELSSAEFLRYQADHLCFIHFILLLACFIR